MQWLSHSPCKRGRWFDPGLLLKQQQKSTSRLSLRVLPEQQTHKKTTCYSAGLAQKKKIKKFKKKKKKKKNKKLLNKTYCKSICCAIVLSSSIQYPTLSYSYPNFTPTITPIHLPNILTK